MYYRDCEAFVRKYWFLKVRLFRWEYFKISLICSSGLSCLYDTTSPVSKFPSSEELCVWMAPMVDTSKSSARCPTLHTKLSSLKRIPSPFGIPNKYLSPKVLNDTPDSAAEYQRSKYLTNEMISYTFSPRPIPLAASKTSSCLTPQFLPTITASPFQTSTVSISFCSSKITTNLPTISPCSKFPSSTVSPPLYTFTP